MSAQRPSEDRECRGSPAVDVQYSSFRCLLKPRGRHCTRLVSVFPRQKRACSAEQTQTSLLWYEYRPTWCRGGRRSSPAPFSARPVLCPPRSLPAPFSPRPPI